MINSVDVEFGSGSLLEAFRCELYAIAHVLLPLAVPILPLLNSLSARLGCAHLAYLLELAHRPASASASAQEPPSRQQLQPQPHSQMAHEPSDSLLDAQQQQQQAHVEELGVPLVVISQHKPEREARDRRAMASSSDASESAARFELRAVLRRFILDCFTNSSAVDAMGVQSANAIHVLGTLSSLCCLDKRGVLSGPMPTPERVILLRARKKAPTSLSGRQLSQPSRAHSPAIGRAPVGIGMGIQLGLKGRSVSEIPSSSATAVCASVSVGGPRGGGGGGLAATASSPVSAQTAVLMLDLTHDHAARHGVSFDEPRWHRHLAQLKPLGLAILLNTCGARTSSQYMRFADHLSSVATLYANLEIAVVNRRCLCTLARLIGFTEGATNAFAPVHTVGLYRHALSPAENKSCATGGTPAHMPSASAQSALNALTSTCTLRPVSTRESTSFAPAPLNPLARISPQTPLANVFSVLVRDRSSGLAHLFSQGTADLLLELCTEYWDGRAIVPLTPTDRRKLLDQYARLSAVAYCTAFAYRPALPDDLPTDADSGARPHPHPAAPTASSTKPLPSAAAAAAASVVSQKRRSTPEVCIELPADLSNLLSQIQRRFQSAQPDFASRAARMRHSVCTRTGSEFQQSNAAHSQTTGETERFLDLEQHQIFIGTRTL